ncbi:hypothetical protein, partial [Catenovulum agarivorans]|uniref:hypothetical protein n=1 Tax=Catenovulum agarivorans TaxID=1172192 RepID=UPI001ED8E966
FWLLFPAVVVCSALLSAHAPSNNDLLRNKAAHFHVEVVTNFIFQHQFFTLCSYHICQPNM